MPTELKIPFRDGETYVQIEGDLNSGPPLIVIHGGPGSGPSYIEPILPVVAADNRPVVLYDQVSVRNTSDIREDGGWPIPLFIEQYLSVLEGLELETANVLGHSWGGFLALEIALVNPEKINKMILSNTSPSSKSFTDCAYQLLLEMPAPLVKILEGAKTKEDRKDDHYRTAADQYYQKHLCRSLPWPEEVKRSHGQTNYEMYNAMWGPEEWIVDGTLEGWDVIDRLSEIDHDTLVISGEFDEAQPPAQQIFLEHMPKVRWEMLKDCSHLSYLEDPASYKRVISEFLD